MIIYIYIYIYRKRERERVGGRTGYRSIEEIRRDGKLERTVRKQKTATGNTMADANDKGAAWLPGTGLTMNPRSSWPTADTRSDR